MPSSLMLPVLATILGMWATGLFLVMPRDDQTVRREIRIAGMVLIGVSVLLLAMLFGTRPDTWPKPQLGWWESETQHWWPESELDGVASGLTFLVFALGTVVAATYAVFANDVKRGVFWFALLLVFAAEMFAFHTAMWAAGFAIVLALFLFRWTRSAVHFGPQSSSSAVEKGGREPSDEAGRDPGLACVGAFLLALSLTGAVTFAMVHESRAANVPSAGTRWAFAAMSNSATGETGWFAMLENHWPLAAALLALAVCGGCCRRLAPQRLETEGRLETEDGGMAL